MGLILGNSDLDFSEGLVKKYFTFLTSHLIPSTAGKNIYPSLANMSLGILAQFRSFSGLSGLGLIEKQAGFFDGGPYKTAQSVKQQMVFFPESVMLSELGIHVNSTPDL